MAGELLRFTDLVSSLLPDEELLVKFHKIFIRQIARFEKIRELIQTRAWVNAAQGRWER